MPDILHHQRQIVGTDMRLGKIKNFSRSSGFDKFLQNLGGIFVLLDAGHQFAVGKRAGTALAELHVRFRRQFARCPKLLHRFLPLAHRSPPFQHNRPQPCFRQTQRRHHSRRPRTGHHRS